MTRQARNAARSRAASRARQALDAAPRSWRNWRRSRPFWGALLVLAGAAEIGVVRLWMPIHSPLSVVPAGVLIAAGIGVCGLLLIFDPVQRSIYAVATILLSVSALATSHLGGYLAGALLGAAGGAIAFAWVPGSPPKTPEPGGASGLTLIIGEADGAPDRSR